jgi:UDP-N-acetylglucosamine 2-epimerase (non-hydrolysing)
MPEEINRVIADHISDLLFAPTENAKELLLKEGIPESKIFVSGNTIVDAVNENLQIAGDSDILEKLGVATGHFMLSTIHRQENTDDMHRLSEIFLGLGMVAEESGMPVILPVHPRTRKMLATFNINIPTGVRLIDPLGFMEFLKAESNARLVLTDSGGVQEECCILRVPCVTIRENTERPETVEVCANIIAGFDHEGIVKASRTMLDRDKTWSNPFGDGFAGNKIIDISMVCFSK